MAGPLYPGSPERPLKLFSVIMNSSPPHACEKKAVARALNNSQRHTNRLKRKAKNLSTDDLVEVLTKRAAAQRAKAEAAVAGAEETPSAETTE